MTRDPYSLVIDGLWTVLETESSFTELVRPSNRIKFVGQARDPIKKNVTEIDVPEVRIISTGTTPSDIHTSHHSSDTLHVSIQVSSGDQRLDYRHFPIKWAIFRAMMRESHNREVLGNLEWGGEKFVVDLKLQTASDGVSESDLNRGIKGWSQVWSMDILMAFLTSAL